MAVDMQFDLPTYRRLFLYASECDKEISGLGRVTLDNGTLTCHEVVLLAQTVGAAHTDITPDGVAQFLDHIMRDRRDTWGQWLLWWHSHAAMSTTFSSQDDETLRSLAKANGEWFTGLVINARGDSKLYLAVQVPIPLMATLGEAVMYSEDDDQIAESVRAEIQEHVTEKVAAKVVQKGMGYEIWPKRSHEDGAINPFSGGGKTDSRSKVANRSFMRDCANTGLCLQCGNVIAWLPVSKLCSSRKGALGRNIRTMLCCSLCRMSVMVCSCALTTNAEQRDSLIAYWSFRADSEEEEKRHDTNDISGQTSKHTPQSGAQGGKRGNSRSRHSRKLDSPSIGQDGRPKVGPLGW